MNMITTESQHQFKLIEGTYSPSEVIENIIPMINTEIERENIRSLSALDGFTSYNKINEDRVKALSAAREELKVLLKTTESDNKLIKVKSSIHVKLL